MLSGWIHQVPFSVHVLLAILSWKRDISTIHIHIQLSISKYIKVYATILRILCVIMIFDKGTPFTFSYTWWKAKSGKFGHCSFWISPLGVAFQQDLPIIIEMSKVQFFWIIKQQEQLVISKDQCKTYKFWIKLCFYVWPIRLSKYFMVLDFSFVTKNGLHYVYITS